MFMRMIYDRTLAQAAYLIGCQKTGEAIVIDPERDIDRYIKLAQQEGLNIVAAAETHIHADFLSGVREFCEQTDARAFLSDEGGTDWDYRWVHEKDRNSAPYKFTLLKDNDLIMIGNIQLRVLHTPGHTPEHICFEVTDLGGEADEPMGIVTGDFMFVGDVGRPDLLETAAGHVGAREPSARRLGESLRKFSTHPDYLQLWPGHGSGSACGKALGAVPQTTMGYERRFNPSFKQSTEPDQFVESILEGQPEPPIYFARMKQENRTGPAVLGGLPQPSQCKSDSIPEGSVIVDTRPWEVFRSGHLPGSYSIVPENSFSTVAGAFIDPDQGIVLVADPDMIEEITRMLIRVGLDRVLFWLDANDLNTRSELLTTQEIDVEQVHALDDPVILDVRNASEFAEGHIPGATNVSHVQLAKRISEVPIGQPIYVNCRSGFRSARAVSYLNEHGFNATNIAGGFLAWDAAGFEVQKP